MKFILYYYICEECGTRFTSAHATSPYGEFLMRSESGDLAYLDAIDDKIFKEFSSSLAQTGRFINDNKTKIKALHENFGFACDFASDGAPYQITNKPLCTNCGNKTFTSFGITNPPEIVDIEVARITHHDWNKKSDQQKKEIIDMVEAKYR